MKRLFFLLLKLKQQKGYTSELEQFYDSVTQSLTVKLAVFRENPKKKGVVNRQQVYGIETNIPIVNLQQGMESLDTHPKLEAVAQKIEEELGIK